MIYLMKLLYPFSLIYQLITSIRNTLFDKGIISTTKPTSFSIGVGNITAGGTGKTPFVDYLIHKLGFYSIAVLSRGYGRKSKGFFEINNASSPNEVGDEPLMLFNINKKKARFYVHENRVEGYKKITEIQEKLELLVLDDVFQHRYIQPDFMILLCDYNRPFYDDKVFPSGYLRESPKGAKRADVIIITKCPINLSGSEKLKIIKRISEYSTKPIFFSNFVNNKPKNCKNKILKNNSKINVVCGLANNDLFISSLAKNFKIQKVFKFKDHHPYRAEDLNEILLESSNKIIVTTQKDYVKIDKIIPSKHLKNIYVVDISVKIENEIDFLDLIFEYYNKSKIANIGD
jgi:tetraacyldisaccharide 4'-kinase